MPVAVSAKECSEEVPFLKLSWSSIGSSSKTDGKRRHIAHSQVKFKRHFIIAEPNRDSVCLLIDGVELVKTLPFWSSYYTKVDRTDRNGCTPVSCVCIAENANTSEIFVAAAAGDCVVVWSATSSILSGNERWQVHSRIRVGQGIISSIDMLKDVLLIGSEHCVSLWTLSSESRLTWKRKWRLRTPKAPLQCLFSPDETMFAILLEMDRRVRLWNLPRTFSTFKPEASSNLFHSRIVQYLSWRREPEEANITNAIITRTCDGVIRLWTSVIDEPNSMRVWSTIDPSAMTSGIAEEAPSCYYLDAFNMYTILRSSLQWLRRDLQMAELGVGGNAADQEKILDLKRSRARRLEHLLTETPDMFALLHADGTLIIRALANIDRKPPTLCQSFVVLKMSSSVVLDPALIHTITAYPLAAAPAASNCYSPSGILFIALNNGEVVKYWITPSLLFDGLNEGLAKVQDDCDFTTKHLLQTTNQHLSSQGMSATVSQSNDKTWSLIIRDELSAFFTMAADTVFTTNDSIVDIAWTPYNKDCPAMLAVACQSAVYILCRQRLTYVDRLRPAPKVFRWTVIAKVDLTVLGNLNITSIAWQSDHTLIIAASNLVLGYKGDLQNSERSASHLILLANQQAGSLKDTDPEVILQCLIWNRVGLALEIFSNLATAIDEYIPSERLLIKPIQWETVETLERKWMVQKNQTYKPNQFDDVDEGDKERLSSLHHLEQLSEKLCNDEVSYFSPPRRVQLAALLDTTVALQQQATLLDSESMRYVACMRHIATVKDSITLDLDYKSFIWAYHSKTQERLLQYVDSFYNGKMDLAVAQRCGIFMWLRSHDDLINCVEQVARQQYSGQDERDPTACSLLYYALGKHKLVANLWRQAFWHKDQKKMLTFLNNDFSQSRWKTAAFKNAFALLSQRRFEMAACFFLLGGGLRDAVNVCTKNLDNLSLGIVIARLYEGGIEGPIFCDLLRKDVLQVALNKDNRWLAHWALSLLGEEDEAIRVLCQPMHTLNFASSLSHSSEATETPLQQKESEFAILISHQLVNRPPPDDIPADVEAKIVLQAHRTLCADGLNALGLVILRSHKLNSIRSVKKQPSQKPELIASPSTKAVQESLPKVKVASLIQAAKPDSSKQAEMTFDYVAF